MPFNSEGYTRANNILMTKYAKPRAVANAHIQCIMGLSVITETNPTRIINEFYDKLVTNIQTLESMGKKKGIRGYVRPTLDKLPGIKSDLVRLDDNWQEWRFPQLVEALKMGVTVRGTQSPWMATLGDVTREKTHSFTLNKRVESIGVVLTVSLKNIIW